MTEKEKAAYAEQLQRRAYLQECLPHLYGFKWYQWAWDFFTSTNKYNFLCAANQISKSSTQIRKCIHWATEKSLWPKLWRTKPTQFWYWYPTKDVATSEYHEKWVKEFLPRGEMKENEKYGWHPEFSNKKILKIDFASGVTVYFKTYEQNPFSVQTSSVFAMFADEEMPVVFYDESNSRITATRGYWHMVFTATLGQEFWRQTIEEKGEFEKFPSAFKRQVSMYDCLQYMDGSPGGFTLDEIEAKKETFKSQAEIDKRVYGRFVIDSDRVYDGFERARNTLKGHKLPKGWFIYTGVDIGSGGKEGHPSAIVFVAVNRNFTKGRVFMGWRGDEITTTSGDVLEKYREMRGRLKVTLQCYDWQAADFFNIASRVGEAFQPADKSRVKGIDLVNTLFKTGMLQIYIDEPELIKLVLELENLKKTTSKTNAKDDFSDALRYAVTRVPWNYEFLTGKKAKKQDPYAGMTDRERHFYEQREKRRNGEIDDLYDEFDEANECYGYFGHD